MWSAHSQFPDNQALFPHLLIQILDHVLLHLHIQADHVRINVKANEFNDIQANPVSKRNISRTKSTTPRILEQISNAHRLGVIPASSPATGTWIMNEHHRAALWNLTIRISRTHISNSVVSTSARVVLRTPLTHDVGVEI
jgi:hypothetical protein